MIISNDQTRINTQELLPQAHAFFISIEGAPFPPTVFLWKKIWNIKQITLCFLSYECFFSRILTREESKVQVAVKRRFLDLWINFCKYCIYQANLFKEQQQTD